MRAPMAGDDALGGAAVHAAALSFGVTVFWRFEGGWWRTIGVLQPPPPPPPEAASLAGGTPEASEPDAAAGGGRLSGPRMASTVMLRR